MRQELITTAFKEVISEVGMTALKQTSLFSSSKLNDPAYVAEVWKLNDILNKLH